MRIFKYWKQHTKVLFIDGTQQPSTAYGGSNLSESDALQDAEFKLMKAQQIINGELYKDTDYEADIMEEIIDTIDENNIITRNRYGALVLNSKNLMFIDIDDYFKSFTDLFFRSKLSQKELMLRKIEKTASKSAFKHLGFRVYETHKGYRVLVTNKDFDARSWESKSMMKNFNADYLYRWLCIKQNCYRARLTPKPHRIKQKRIKVIFPDRTTLQQQELTNWLNDYDQKSQDYSSCHLVKEIGNVRMNDAIEYHDRVTNIKWPSPLA
ncbi:MAG: hypothetical protein ACSHWW_13610 [Nonlabens sp.]|uniref:hypothetical protein n=1 Tax=Nonlabens sp. TaxID=1888209 RepID=UPI003EFA2F56